METNQEKVKKSFNINIFLVKLDRVAAWILLFIMLAYAITGYGMTKGLIDAEVARAWHLGWLGALGLVAFVIHTSLAIRNALKRWRIWNRLSCFFLCLFYLALAIFFLYVHFFYSAEANNYNQPVDTPILKQELDTAADRSAQAPVVIDKNKVFTAQELSLYNGLNGRAAYAAVDGLVYDFSSLFRNGRHAGHKAGQDLSVAFHGAHPDSFLKKYAVVGTFSQ